MLFQDFLRCIQQRTDVKAGDKLLLAVSGGADSVVLAHLMKRVSPVLHIELGIAHCNFTLRGADADADAEFVSVLAKELELPLHTVVFDTVSVAKERKISIEMAARDLRYGYFKSLMTEKAYRYCVLAHHADDNMETFFINLLRGTGIRGLRGMRVQSDHYLRPLLSFSRADIEAYARQHQLTYRTDHTNFQDIYLRNKLRLNILPQLKELNPRFPEHLKRSMQLLQALDKADEKRYAVWYSQLVCEFPEGKRLNLSKLKAMAQEDFFLFTERFLRDLGFLSEQIEQIRENVIRGHSGKRFQNPSQVGCLYRERDSLVWIASAHTTETSLSSWEDHGQGIFKIEDRRQPAVGSPVHYKAECKSFRSLSELPEDRYTVCLNMEKLQFPLYWRTWKAGDSFFPLGMEQRQKLSDFFNNQKLSSLEKQNVLLLCSADDIVWIAGYRMDHRYRVQFPSSAVYCVKLSGE